MDPTALEMGSSPLEVGSSPLEMGSSPPPFLFLLFDKEVFALLKTRVKGARYRPP